MLTVVLNLTSSEIREYKQTWLLHCNNFEVPAGGLIRQVQAASLHNNIQILSTVSLDSLTSQSCLTMWSSLSNRDIQFWSLLCSYSTHLCPSLFLKQYVEAGYRQHQT